MRLAFLSLSLSVSSNWFALFRREHTFLFARFPPSCLVSLREPSSSAAFSLCIFCCTAPAPSFLPSFLSPSVSRLKARKRSEVRGCGSGIVGGISPCVAQARSNHERDENKDKNRHRGRNNGENRSSWRATTLPMTETHSLFLPLPPFLTLPAIRIIHVGISRHH